MPSLVKSPVVTPEKLAANQANGKQSHGPATEAGIERIRAANTRHGFYSKAPGAEMRALGEDPEQYERLYDSLLADWQPENEYQTSLVRRMARLMWRLERFDRIQESLMVYQLQALDHDMARDLRELTAKHEQVVPRLRAFMLALDGNKFHTTGEIVQCLRDIYGEAPRGAGFEIMSRAWRLLPAETAFAGAVGEKAADVGLSIATGSDRDVLRAELRILLREEIKAREAAFELRRTELGEMTAAFRDTMLIPKHPYMAYLLQSKDSDLRQLRFVTDLLMKVKAKKPAPASADANNPAEAGTGRDIPRC
jgi:hypothetical protein